ncbi:hypothetical protein ACRAQ7_03885 [Erythrobacter sp. W53]|uniref:hypothetical protein n=1 Tax=Erythrobacter sp. W53 TaxID=3425947 RepID=UPI003D768FAC
MTAVALAPLTLFAVALLKVRMQRIAMKLGRMVQSVLPKGELAAPISRPTFLNRVDRRSCLEIGPFDCPVVEGAGVRYFDVLDSEQLADRSARHGRDADASTIPHIDYVSPTGDLAIVDRTFTAAVSSHCIEHQPDLIAHLLAVGRLLEPGGRYFVLCPDKRYCFDYFHRLSVRADIDQAHAEERRLHDCSRIRAHTENATHNSAMKHWLGLHGRPRVENDSKFSAIADEKCAASARGEYVDVHAWIFSDESFNEIVGKLCDEDVIPFELLYVTRTHFGSVEFFAELRKKGRPTP